MSPWVEMNKPKIVICVLFGGEKIAYHVILKSYKVLAELISEAIAGSLFQSKVQVIINYTFYGS